MYLTETSPEVHTPSELSDMQAIKFLVYVSLDQIFYYLQTKASKLINFFKKLMEGRWRHIKYAEHE